MRSLVLTSIVTLTTVALPSTASADDRAVAQQVFQEGRELMAAGRVAEACPKFAAAAQLSQTAGVRLNLAECYGKLGKTASAWVKINEALALAERSGDSVAASVARAQISALRPNLSYLTITVAPGTAARGLEVDLDGEKIPDAAWGTAFPVDPGEHEVSAQAPARSPWSTKTTVSGAGARATVSVPELPNEETRAVPVPGAPVGAAVSVTTTAGSAPAGGGERSPMRMLAVVSGGLGVTGLGIGAIFGLAASAKKSAYEQHQAHGACLDEECVALSKDALASAGASTLGFVVGGALVVTGAVLWLAAPTTNAERRAVAVVPLAGPHGMGAGVLGSW